MIRVRFFRWVRRFFRGSWLSFICRWLQIVRFIDLFDLISLENY